MAKMKYKHKFSLRIGEIAHVNGVPCESLGLGNFGTNTYPGKPASASQSGVENDGLKSCGYCGYKNLEKDSHCHQCCNKF